MPPEFAHRLVDFLEQLAQHVAEPAPEVLGRHPVALGQQFGDLVDRDPAGEFAALGAAHSVADREHEIPGFQRAVTEFAQ